jgi:hypothetical protein
MFRTDTRRATLCVLAWAFSATCAVAQTLHGVPNTNRRVIDTGLESLATRHPVNPIRWLDAYTLTFSPLQTGPDSKLKKALRGVLYDTRTQSHITIVENGEINCAGGDLVRYRRSADSAEPEYVRVSADRKSVQPVGPYKVERFGLDPYTCLQRKQPATPGRLEAFLRESDGYIDRGRVGDGAVEQAILYRPGKPPLELPLRGQEIRSVRFVPFLDKYYIGGWRLLSAEGIVSEVPRPRPIQNLRLAPGGGGIVRDGIVSLGGTSEHGDWGLFHASDRAVERLASGWIPAVSVSPDGCRVAFVSGPGYYFEHRNSLKFVNLCDEA